MVLRSQWPNGDTIYTKSTKSLGIICLFCVKSNEQQRAWINKWKLAFKSGVNWFFCPFSFKGPQLEPVRLVMVISIVCHTPPRTASCASLLKVENWVNEWRWCWPQESASWLASSVGNQPPCIPRTTSRCPAWSLWWACSLLSVNCF